MSNTWFYKIYISPRNVLAPEELRNIIRIVKDVGFSPFNPVDGKVKISWIDWSSNDFITQEFEDVESMVASTRINDSILQIWKGNIDACIGFKLKPGNKENNSNCMNFPMSILSIIIDNTFFREHRTDRKDIARDITTIFVNLCDYFNASYGFSFDENIGEEFCLYSDQDMKSEGDPQYLFWLNFFSNERSNNTRLKEMISLGGRITSSETGIVVSFSDTPWKGEFSFITDINHIWKNNQV